MNISAAIRITACVGLSVAGLYTAFRAAKSFQALREAKAKTKELQTENSDLIVTTAQEMSASAEAHDVRMAAAEERIAEVRVKVEQNSTDMTDQVAEFEEELQRIRDVLDEPHTDPDEFEQIQANLERGDKHGRQRKGTRRSTDSRRDRRGAAGE
jgi:hypothetical protein